MKTVLNVNLRQNVKTRWLLQKKKKNGEDSIKLINELARDYELLTRP